MMSLETITNYLTAALALVFLNAAPPALKVTRLNLVGVSATSIPDRFTGYIPRAFAPNSSEKLAVTIYVRNTKGVTHGQLLIKSSKAAPLKQVALEPEGRFELVQWSPDGKRIAYLTSPLSKTADVSPKQLTVVVLQSGKKTRLSDDAAAPQWSADGSTLSYFQHKPDGWMAHRSTGWQGASSPVTSALPVLRFPSPGAFATDGKRVAFLDKDRIKVITVDGKPVSEVTLPDGREMEMKSIQWSPDNRWLLVQATELYSHVRATSTFLIEPATRRLVSLNDSLSTKSEQLTTRSASWLPGVGHRLLAHVTKASDGFDAGPMESTSERLAQRNGKWLLYSLENSSVRTVEGITPLTEQESDRDVVSFSDREPQITASLDGRYVLINGRSYQITGK